TGSPSGRRIRSSLRSFGHSAVGASGARSSRHGEAKRDLHEVTAADGGRQPGLRLTYGQRPAPPKVLRSLTMLTADGCRARRARLRAALRGRVDLPALALADPIHPRDLANFHVDPCSFGADFGALLVVGPDGHATVYHDRRLPDSVQAAHVDAREVVPWYDGQTPGHGPRRLALRPAIEANGGRVHDSL